MRLKFHLVALSGLLLASCMPQNYLPPMHSFDNNVEVRSVASDFNHANMWGGEVVFGGVTSKIIDWDAAKMRALSQKAYEELLSEKYFVRIHPPEVFVYAIGEERFVAVNRQYREMGELDRDALDSLAEGLPKIRYVVFSRIESDEKEENSESTPEYEDGEITEYYHTDSVTRTVSASIRIYDLKNRSVAWEADVYSSLSRSNSYEEHVDSSFGESLANGLINGGGPEMPSDSEVVSSVHDMVSSELPKPCENKAFLACEKLKQALKKELKEARS